jgi:Domain of unknown function (DUF362)/TAT (twin-arginine translocation) pathway signal sequence
MSDKKRTEIDRRDFIVGAAATAAAVGLGAGGLSACSDDTNPPPADTGPGKEGGADGPLADGPLADTGPACDSTPAALPAIGGPATVVEVHDPKSVTTTGVDAVRAKAMLIAGLNKLAGETDIKQAWKKLIPDFSATMKIGLKTNCLSSKLYSSNELLLALIETLVNDLGADSSKIWVWDRRTDELTRSKLTQAALKVKVAGTLVSTTDASGPGYEKAAECVLKQATRVSTILSQETDITINLPLLKTHNISGITGAMKNTYGCIDNPGDFHSGFNDDLPAIYRLDAIRKPMRLHICEAFKAVTKNYDPTGYPDAMPGRLLISADPVALDTQSLKLVNALRTANPKLQPVTASMLKWLDGAAALNLGTKNVDEKLVTL